MPSRVNETVMEDLVRRGRAKFQGYQDLGFQSEQGTRFYDYNIGGERYIIKHCRNRERFEAEINALEALESTERVCEFCFHTKFDETYRDGSYKGAYYIVKRFYEKSVTSEANSPLTLIERAAQLAEISRLFLEAGWRDLDGNLENDRVRADGRVVRIDLDASLSRWRKPPKYQPLYLSEAEVQAIYDLERIDLSLFKESAEVDSLAVRLAELLLNDGDAGAKRANNILALRKPAGPGKRSWWRPWKSPQADDGEDESIRVEKEREAWLDFWDKRISIDPKAFSVPTLDKLRQCEARFLGALFFHILARADHGFRLTDIYQTLMTLHLSALSDWVREAREGASPGRLEKLAGVVTRLHEIDRFVKDKDPPPEPPREAEKTPEPPKPPPPEEVFELNVRYGGKDWRATVKGTEWVSQDITRGDEGKGVFLLADGVTLANGGLAVSVIGQMFEEWIENFNPATQGDAEYALANLAEMIQLGLRRRVEELKEECESTLVLCAVYRHPQEPAVLLLRFGNSGYVVTHQNVDGGRVWPMEYSSSKVPTVALGADVRDLNAAAQVVSMALDKEGIYRIRAYSDGIAVSDKKMRDAERLLEGPEGIGELIERVGGWHETEGFAHIGEDDWSVAGFDVEVRKVRPSEPEREQEAEAEQPAATPAFNPFEKLDNIDPNKFTFSGVAYNFWSETIERDDTLWPLASYPIVSRHIKLSLPQQSARQEETDKQKPETTGQTVVESAKVKEKETAKGFSYLGGSKRKQVIADLWEIMPKKGVIIAAVFVALLLLIIVLSRRGRIDETDRSRLNANAAANANVAGESRALDFSEDAAAQEIWRGVTSRRGYYELTGLPGGAKVSGTGDPLWDEKFIRFARGVSAVAEAKGLKLRVEVYTDLDGSTDGNLRRSQARADALKKLITSIASGVEPLIECIGRGEADAINIRPGSPEEVTLNRRLRVVVNRQ